jgi:phosphoribosyl-dephospho-CoA transferase
MVMPGRKLIQDEFTALPLSRQRKYQLRQRRDGKCMVCGVEAFYGGRCAFHHIKNAVNGLAARQRSGQGAARGWGKWLGHRN